MVAECARMRLVLWRPDFHGDKGYNRTVVESVMPCRRRLQSATGSVPPSSISPSTQDTAEILRDGAIPTHEIVMVLQR